MIPSGSGQDEGITDHEDDHDRVDERWDKFWIFVQTDEKRYCQKQRERERVIWETLNWNHWVQLELNFFPFSETDKKDSIS